MKLLTHNMLQCTVKGCTKNYPLLVIVKELEREDKEFSAAFITRMLPRLDWKAVAMLAKQLNAQDRIPEELPPINEAIQNETFLQNLHDFLLNTSIKEGCLKCPGCNREYPIKEGIPNMLLNEDEV